MEGSGRSLAAFDLHAGLTACAEHLDRFGGHRAAAGLSIHPDAVDAFAEAFAAHADANLTDEQLRLTIVDAAVPARSPRSASRRSFTDWRPSVSATRA